jgi:hypothetical protein
MQVSHDKQAPVRTAFAGSPLLLIGFLLFAFSKVGFSGRAPSLRRRELDPSPPFGGNCPQAVLRLWLI